MCAVKQQPQEQPQTSRKHILQKHLQIDQLIFVSYGMHTTHYFVSLGIFMRQGCRTQR